MPSNTYTYISDTGEHITNNGFVTSLLQQGQEWQSNQIPSQSILGDENIRRGVINLIFFI